MAVSSGPNGTLPTLGNAGADCVSPCGAAGLSVLAHCGLNTRLCSRTVPLTLSATQQSPNLFSDVMLHHWILHENIYYYFIYFRLIFFFWSEELVFFHTYLFQAMD